MLRRRHRRDGAAAEPPKRRIGLTRLSRYLSGRWLRVALLSVVGVCSAAAPVAALLVVQDAINNGMQAHDEARLTRDVDRLPPHQRPRLDPADDPRARARPRRPGRRARAPRGPLRPSDHAVAEVLLAAEGRLDHRPHHLGRGRALGRPLAGADDARRQHADPGRGGRRALRARLAPRARRARHPAADADPHAVVPGALARGVPARARDDRVDDRADRGVGVGDGRDPGLQPRARLPRRVRRRQRREPAHEHARAVAELALLPGDRVPRASSP